MLIYKIFTADQWRELDAAGDTAGAPVDLADGYIHFSTAVQAAETASKHFGGQVGLVLAAVDPDPLGDALVWEVSRGGALFPHLYARLKRSDVLWVKELPIGPDGAHVFPEGML
ncbi:MAG: DUF952 domain-containing protein [Pikeienuella sp.]